MTYPLYSDLNLAWFGMNHKKIWAARRALYRATK
jgi:hypothetical protein